MQPKFCNKCGAPLIPNAVFCEKCGSKVRSVTEMSAAVQQPSPQMAPQAYQQIPPQMAPQRVPPQMGMPNTGKPQGNGKEIGGIIIGIVLLLVVVMVITFLSKGSDKATSQTTQNKNTAVPENEEETEGFLGLGETGHYEGFAVTINGISAPNPDELFDHPAEGMEYILLNVEVMNESKEIADCPGKNCFTLVINGEQYGNDQRSVYNTEGDKYGGDPLDPGQTHCFASLFQVPIGTRDYEVLYVPGFDGRKLTYRFSIDAIADYGSVDTANNSDSATTSELDPEQCSTTDRPEAEDFVWFTERENDWVFGITPFDAQMIDTFEKTLGSWKGMDMVYDYDGTLLGCAFFTVTLSGEPGEVEANLHWHHMQWADGTREELVYNEDEKMIGEFDYAGIVLGGPGNQIDLLCYERNGKQYAEGIWTVQSGEDVRFAMVRP